MWQQKRVNGQTIVNFGCCCSFVHCGFWSIVCMFGGLQLEPVKLLPSIVENLQKYNFLSLDFLLYLSLDATETMAIVENSAEQRKLAFDLNLTGLLRVLWMRF